jgi:hypothetical protein
MANIISDGVYAEIIVISRADGRIEGHLVHRIGVVGSGANSGDDDEVGLPRATGSLGSDPRSSKLK